MAFLKETLEAFMNFKSYKELFENETNIKIKCLRTNNGGEFTANEFNEFCETHGIRRQFSAPKNPKKNGLVERKNIAIQEASKTMVNEAKLLDKYSREEIYKIVYVHNNSDIS